MKSKRDHVATTDRDVRRLTNRAILVLSFSLSLLVVFGGCGRKNEQPDGQSIKSAIPNEAQRALRQENQRKRQEALLSETKQRSNSLVVLNGVLKDDGIRLTEQDWEKVWFVEDVYADIWQQNQLEIEQILTEEQQEIRAQVQKENEAADISPEQALSIVDECLNYTPEQEARLSTLRHVFADIRREAASIVLGLLSPAEISEEWRGESSTTDLLANIALTDDQWREVWNIDDHVRCAIEELKRRDLPINMEERIARTLQGGTVAQLMEILTATQISQLPQGVVRHESRVASETQTSMIDKLVTGITLSPAQREGLALIEEQFSRQLDSLAQRRSELLTAEQKAAGTAAKQRAQGDGLAEKDVQAAVNTALAWTPEQNAARTIIENDEGKLKDEIRASLKQVLTPDQFRKVTESTQIRK